MSGLNRKQLLEQLDNARETIEGLEATLHSVGAINKKLKYAPDAFDEYNWRGEEELRDIVENYFGLEASTIDMSVLGRTVRVAYSYDNIESKRPKTNNNRFVYGIESYHIIKFALIDMGHLEDVR